MLNKPDALSWMDWFRDVLPGCGRPVDDLHAVPQETTTLSLTGKSTGWDRLPRMTALRHLAVREISANQVDLIAELPGLEELRVFGFRGPDAGALARLTNLRLLTFEWAPKIETIGWLSALRRLEFLIVGDLRRVQDFSPVGDLAGLRALSITSAAVGPLQQVETLGPLTQLRRLEDLSLALRLATDDLSPLAKMVWLERLTISNTFPVAEFARLAAYLTATASPVLAPVARYGHGAGAQVMLIGKPIRFFDANDPKAPAAIAKRTAEFERLKAQFAAHAQG